MKLIFLFLFKEILSTFDSFIEGSCTYTNPIIPKITISPTIEYSFFFEFKCQNNTDLSDYYRRRLQYFNKVYLEFGKFEFTNSTSKFWGEVKSINHVNFFFDTTKVEVSFSNIPFYDPEYHKKDVIIGFYAQDVTDIRFHVVFEKPMIEGQLEWISPTLSGDLKQISEVTFHSPKMPLIPNGTYNLTTTFELPPQDPYLFSFGTNFSDNENQAEIEPARIDPSKVSISTIAFDFYSSIFVVVVKDVSVVRQSNGTFSLTIDSWPVNTISDNQSPASLAKFTYRFNQDKYIIKVSNVGDLFEDYPVQDLSFNFDIASTDLISRGKACVKVQNDSLFDVTNEVSINNALLYFQRTGDTLCMVFGFNILTLSNSLVIKQTSFPTKISELNLTFWITDYVDNKLFSDTDITFKMSSINLANFQVDFRVFSTLNVELHVEKSCLNNNEVTNGYIGSLSWLKTDSSTYFQNDIEKPLEVFNSGYYALHNLQCINGKISFKIPKVQSLEGSVKSKKVDFVSDVRVNSVDTTYVNYDDVEIMVTYSVFASSAGQRMILTITAGVFFYENTTVEIIPPSSSLIYCLVDLNSMLGFSEKCESEKQIFVVKPGTRVSQIILTIPGSLVEDVIFDLNLNTRTETINSKVLFPAKMIPFCVRQIYNICFECFIGYEFSDNKCVKLSTWFSKDTKITIDHYVNVVFLGSIIMIAVIFAFLNYLLNIDFDIPISILLSLQKSIWYILMMASITYEKSFEFVLFLILFIIHFLSPLLIFYVAEVAKILRWQKLTTLLRLGFFSFLFSLAATLIRDKTHSNLPLSPSKRTALSFRIAFVLSFEMILVIIVLVMVNRNFLDYPCILISIMGLVVLLIKGKAEKSVHQITWVNKDDSNTSLYTQNYYFQASTRQKLKEDYELEDEEEVLE